MKIIKNTPILLLFGFLFFSLDAIGKTKNLGIFSSSKKNIKISSGKYSDWHFDPTINPDVLQVYCENKNTEVIFFLPENPLRFTLNEKDTVCFSVLLNEGKDTAHVRVIGIKEFPNTLSSQEKVYQLSRFWSEAKYNFVNMDQIDFSWDSLYFSFIPKVMSTKNDYEYARLMSTFAASLKDGHTEIYIGSKLLSLYNDYIPMGLMDFDKRVYIVAVRKGVGLDSTLLGGEIISISGLPVLKYFQDSLFPYISASTEQHLWMQAIYKCQSGLRKDNFKAEVKKTDGSIVAINIKRNGEATRTETDEYFQAKRPERSWESVELQWLKDSVALLKIRRFFPVESTCESLYALQNEISKAKGLIIDIRENGGGATTVGWFVQSYLTKPGTDYFLNYAWSTRINDGVRKANGNWIEKYEDFYKEKASRYEEPDTVYIGDTILRYTMPTAILIGRYTFSAAEDFLVNLYEVPERPVLIGEPTGGSTGSPLVVPDMPLDGYARICTRRINYPYSKKAFVQEGVKPDILVKESFEDYFEGKDAVLERAVEYLKMGK